MRKDVEKYLFIGLEEDKELFFKRAQEEGMIHFISPSTSKAKDIPEDVYKTGQAIRILRGQLTVEQEENYQGLDEDSIVNSILSLQKKIDKALEEKRLVAMDISRIEVYGNFSLDDIAYIEREGKCHLQFFTARPTLFQNEDVPNELIFIGSEHGLDYYLSIADQPFVYEKMIELKFKHSLSELKHRLSDLEKTGHEAEAELKTYVKYNEFLHHALVDKLNRYHLFHTQSYVQEILGGNLFALEGWVPVTKTQVMTNICEDTGVHAEEIAIEESDVIPTYLENSGQARIGEDLVHIYDTPSATDKDPSMWVLYGFALFFAFIIGDAGYGMLYLALALFLRWKYPDLKGSAKRVLNLFTILSMGCVIWGTLMTSFFGMQIDIDNPLRKVSLLQWLAEKKATYHVSHQDAVFQDWMAKYPELQNVTDIHQFVSFVPKSNVGHGNVILNRLTDNIMFELALFVGVVHLIISALRYSRRHWQNFGWALFLLGAYLYFPYYLKTPSFLNFVGGIDLEKGGKFGFELMIAGIGIAWVLSIIRNGWTGIFEIVTLIQIFADTLSYLRLYALGLAGAIVGSTVNEIASTLPLMFAIVLVVVSHFINIILGTMSGIIHGLRLNFLEWYHYSFEGGGRQFQPLKLLKRE